MNRPRHAGNPNKPSGEKAQLVLAYQELGNELHSTQLKVIGNYTLGRVIGEGSFGTVRLGIHRLTGSRVAIKHIPKSSSPPLLTREIHHHRRLHHPNVVQLYEVIATEHSIWLITELCSGGELFDYLVEKTRFSEFEARRLFGQICLGLGYVHGKGVVHRDLKLENVLLDERCNPKLADFGFGREFEPRKLLDTFCGTTGYAAPEMLAGKKYLGEEVDIWSLGIILHALLTGSLPFDDDDEEQMKAMIMVGNFEIPNFLSNEAVNLIQSILQLDPKARPSIEKILSHPWFTTPPLQHSFGEPEPLSRPSPIIEEAQQLPKSPSTSMGTFPSSADQPHRTPSRGSPPISSNHPNQSCHSILDSDASGHSSKESDLSVSSARSSTSSPVTSEDLPAQMPAIPDLGLSSSHRPAGHPSKSTPASNHKPSPLLHHSNSSHSTIRNSQHSIPHNNHLQHLPTHAEDENDTALSLSNFSPSSDQDPGASPQSSNVSPSNLMTGSSKPRPLSILSCVPSSLSHPQIRTPSRTKRRSIGSTLSERIGPFEDGASSDFATPTTNQARLSTSSLLTVVIDYVGALKATTQAPLLSPEDLTFMKSLSDLGFDTGQIVHSVQSFACDSSGALWWLMKRKKEKQSINREDTERDSNCAATKDPFNTHGPVEIQSPDSALTDDRSANSVVVTAPIPSFSHASVPIIAPPEDLSPTLAKSIPAPPNHSKKPVTPTKTNLPITSSPRVEPVLNLAKVEKEAGMENPIIGAHRSYLNLKANFGSSSKNNPLTATPSNLNDDACSSTSSAKFDTLSSSDKETPFITVDLAAPAKKSTADLRKRSQSVSMLQRATHALGTKKSADDRHKSRSREGSSTNDGDEKHGHEKISKKDLKAREKESRMDEHSKPSGSLPLSGLFSRKTLLIPSLPPLPASLMLHQASGGSEKSADKSKPKELDVPLESCPSVSSRPSSPLRTIESPLKPKDDGDPALNALAANEQSISTTPSLSGSSSSFNAVSQNLLVDHPDSFSTPKPNSPSRKSHPTAPNSRADERKSVKETSPATSSLADPSSSHVPSPSESETVKAARSKGPKGNLFSNFRFWFNEDRRKRKQNMAILANYGHAVKSPTRMGSQTTSPNGGVGGSVASSSHVSDFPSRKVAGDLQALRSVSGSVVVHRRPSKGSRRSSMQSTRQLSLELHNASKATSKRRSGSSRASFGSVTDARTPGSEPGSHASLSQHTINHSRGSMEGPNRSRRAEAHGRHGSISSAGSRRSAAALQLLTPHSVSAMHPAYSRRTPSAGTTVRRVTAPASTAAGSTRHRQHKASSLTSSVRTSLSSDDGAQLINRGSSGGADEHRLHSPNNVYDVEETIEEEDDGGEENPGKEVANAADFESGLKTDAARQSAFQKLSGDVSDKHAARHGPPEGGAPAPHQSGSGGGGSRTIFMAHKPHSVFGTPTQAFFARANQSPVSTKFNPVYGTGNSSVLAYVNLMNSIADGPTSSSSSSRRNAGPPKLRDVFASKAKDQDGEWVDLDDEDDAGARYEGGIGQGVKARNGPASAPATAGPLVRPGPGLDGKPGPCFGASTPNSAAIHQPAPSSSSSTGPTAGTALLAAPKGGSPAPAGLIGNWRGGNPRVTPTFKAIAIEEEEEEEEDE
ncbi:CAMK/CAMKL/MARK protein kinase [Puccinia triticina 1-1 BBBD Race 1]|uniref:non-specific serine/threonine protein kinase n=2 Tax=Puccinia triticina TaxID=208348 RepID=A0A180GL21_PUCT1|nr:uncharacterized protein PtA15_6A157 [Puccinia triticina]OAV93380.1 CAMK/CAMKL/MARK protein kinase [Puccinia triticina 1-1 BBBD Race 1]WAQ85529.1 hypothetical protein PtA15_6A157 [Puccinia triticina]WAR55410.1 hypothetical protein PtB15_6B151 [Puccinia triticina]